jgi:glycosyltransferase involved in cell wall biosynthesis
MPVSPMTDYSVLMSVYARADHRHLGQALDSICRQTMPPSEIVLVGDGPLTAELDAVIASYRTRSGTRLVTIRLERNVGLGAALQVGLEACSYPIVARMDADDVAIAVRCEKQLRFLETHPEVDVVGAWIAEFADAREYLGVQRIVPAGHDEIVDFARWRNPINHMSVMFRKERVIAAGGYRPLEGVEDYFLWVRMILNGSRFANIPEVLVHARTGPDHLSRRGGLGYARSELTLQREMRRRGLISRGAFVRNVCVRFIARVMPSFVRRHLYKQVRYRGSVSGKTTG